MPDPAARSPLAAAAEAHVAVVRKALRLDEADGRMTDAEAAEAMTAVVFSVTALRAAVAADAAWRARAEAAVAVMEAQTRLDMLYAMNAVGMSREDNERWHDDVTNTRFAAIAARRRYEETCRG